MLQLLSTMSLLIAILAFGFSFTVQDDRRAQARDIAGKAAIAWIVTAVLAALAAAGA